jgi:hypothetical protein
MMCQDLFGFDDGLPVAELGELGAQPAAELGLAELDAQPASPSVSVAGSSAASAVSVGGTWSLKSSTKEKLYESALAAVKGVVLIKKT